MDALQCLWESTAALYERFNLDAPAYDRVRKFREETNEFLREVRAFGQYNGSRIALTEEAVDVIVTTIGLLQKLGVTPEQLAEQVNAVIAKNDAKTPETHVIHNGLITRKDKVQP